MEEGALFEYRLVEIHGLLEEVLPKSSALEPAKKPVDANGKKGCAVQYDREMDKYWVETFDGLLLAIPEENLKEYEAPEPEDGGFDLVWPCHQEYFDTFCGEVNNRLVSKGYCMVQMNKSDESREQAASKAKKKEFMVPKKEFAQDYLGRKASGKVTKIEPLKVTTGLEIQETELPPDVDALTLYDLDMSSLFAVMGPMCFDTQGFHAHGRTDMQVWTNVSNKRETQIMVSDEINEDDIEEGLVERHIKFLKQRKLCFLYMVDNAGGRVTLCPREDLEIDMMQFPIDKGRLLVYRCDIMSFKYEPLGDHLTLQSWVLEDPPVLQLRDFEGDDESLTQLQGILQGPDVPKGEQARVMSLACITGGGASDSHKAMMMYMTGTDAHTHVSNSRFDVDLYISKDGEEDFKPYQNSYHRHGGFCPDEDVMGFDHKFFEMSADEASIMWPNQRKTLEVGYEVLHRGGFTKETVRGKPILVYMGDCGSEWWSILFPRMYMGEWIEKRDLDWNAARSMAVTGGRLSHVLGLKGPHWLCDTACSSGLTAFCTAMYGMKKAAPGEDAPTLEPHATGCLSGGVNMIVDAGVYIGNSATHMLSLKGRCFTFDVGGDGYARGEGCSIAYSIVSDREKDSQAQEGVAIGNKVNQDGRSASMTAPNGPAQQACIQASLKEANVLPHDITASECHGTGTSLGDPIEVGSLRGVQETDDRDNGLCCTSSKSNIGHLEADAGVTGLFKCILMCKFALAPPNCHMRTLNPHLDAAGWPSYFESDAVDYAQNTGIVGVSSFGISGTNSHAEVWGQCRLGCRSTGNIDMQKLDQISITCPVTLGPIDSVTGEPLRKPTGDREKYHADILRGELAQYDISSYAYNGEYRYRKDELDDGEMCIDPGLPVTICSSCTGWEKMEEMERQEDNSYLHTLILGDSRCEYFYICLNGNKDYCIYPSIHKATPRIYIRGPEPDPENRLWMIDGRDEEVPAGTVYQIYFKWGEERKQVFWKEVGPKHASKATRYDHRYFVVGSWTSWQPDELQKDPEEDGVWEYSVRIGLSGQEEFQFVRDQDMNQCIYPAQANATKTNIPIRGPDDMSNGKSWLMKGPVDEIVKLRLEIDDAKITVALISETKGERVWESKEGWERHEYHLVGSWMEGKSEIMEMDFQNPGVFKCKGTFGSDWSSRFNRLVEYFKVVVDGDPDMSWYPEVHMAAPGDTLAMGPGHPGENMFMVRSFFVGATFEVVLNLNAADMRKIVTWRLDQCESYDFAQGVPTQGLPSIVDHLAKINAKTEAMEDD